MPSSLNPRPMNRSALIDSQRSISGAKRIVGQTASVRASEDRNEAPSVVVIASVEAKDLLVDVGVKVERARRNVRPVQRPLEARPKVLDAVRVDPTFAVGHHVVDERMGVAFGRQRAIRAKRIGVDRGARKHVRADMRDERRAFVVRNDHRLDARRAPTLHHTEHGRLTLERPVLHLLKSEFGSHGRTAATTDEGFVRFDLAREQRGLVVLHGLTDAVQHEPSGLLGDAEGACEFVRGRSVLRVGEQPQGRKPLAERDGAMLEDRVRLGREVPATVLAAPNAARLNWLYGRRAASRSRAGHAVRPTAGNDVRQGAVGVREVGYGFQERGRRVHAPIVYSAGDQWVARSSAIGISS